MKKARYIIHVNQSQLRTQALVNDLIPHRGVQGPSGLINVEQPCLAKSFLAYPGGSQL